MRILIVTQYFWPESFIVNDMVRLLSEQGHHVEVLTGKPNYPDGQIYEGYSEAGHQQQMFAGRAQVHRVPLRPRRGGRALDLIRNYLSFVWNGTGWARRVAREGRFDLVFAVAFSPITSVIPAIAAKRALRAPLVVWVQDLWPESLSATGFIKSPVLLWLVRLLVRGIYRESDRILVQSRAFIAPVEALSAKGKVSYYPNCFLEREGDLPQPPEAAAEVLSRMDERFCVVFAGNLGKAQAIETIVEAAALLRHIEDICIVLVGSGSMLDWVRQQKVERGLDNVILAGRFAADVMPHFFSRADALLVSLKRDEILSFTVPSKVQAYLAAGRPIIASLDGEGAKVVQEAGAGVACPAEDAQGLREQIEALRAMERTTREKMGAAGRAYFLEHFEMCSQVAHLADILDKARSAGKKLKEKA